MQHDSINTYSPESQPARNLHMRSARLADCLLVVGVGGSVPGYLEADGSQVWAGFPYSSDESYGEDLSKVLDPMFGLHGSNTQLQQQDAVILMTHVGPHKSCAYGSSTYIPVDLFSRQSAFIVCLKWVLFDNRYYFQPVGCW